MKKIVFLDIDGTLVTPNYPLSALVKKGIKKARENGHLIFLCTGRNRVSIENIMSDDFDGCICSAGGYLEIKGEMIETTYLDKEEVDFGEYNYKKSEQNYVCDLYGKHLKKTNKKIKIKKFQFFSIFLSQFPIYYVYISRTC